MIHETAFLSRDLFSMAGSYPFLHGEVMKRCAE